MFNLVTSGILAVDTFFFLSGFLGAYLFLVKYPTKSKCLSPIKVLIAYFHRYYRLTPLLAFIVYFSTYVIFPLTSGPVRMGVLEENVEKCKEYGWTTILYINNFYPKLQDFTCFDWTWYLANDMQMFLLLPWIVISYKATKLGGSLFILALYIANFAATFYITYHY